MATTQYIGARYVPVFGRAGEDSAAWDNSSPYEPLTIVLHQGNSYTSKQYVPAGIEITNESYWALTGNYNAQIEQYRSEVQALAQDVGTMESDVAGNTQGVQTNATAIAAEKERAEAAESAIVQAARNEYKAWNGKKALIIGDSFSDETSGSKWPTYLAQSLGFTYQNYAVGSTGFVDPGSSGQEMPFANQVAKAATDLSAEEREAIDYVFVFGGYNDVSRSDVTASIMQTAANNVSTAISTSFPNAMIICIPMNWRVDKFSSTARNYAGAIVYGMTANTSAPVKIIDQVWTWLLCSSAHYGSDLLHPNEKGYRQLAKFIEARLFGGCERYVMEKFSLSSGYSYYESGTGYPFLKGDMVIIPGAYINFDSAMSAQTTIGTVPDILVPSGTQYGVMAKGNAVVGTWAVSSGGNVILTPSSGVTISSGAYLAPISYLAYGVVS